MGKFDGPLYDLVLQLAYFSFVKLSMKFMPHPQVPLKWHVHIVCDGKKSLEILQNMVVLQEMVILNLHTNSDF